MHCLAMVEDDPRLKSKINSPSTTAGVPGPGPGPVVMGVGVGQNMVEVKVEGQL